MNPWPFIVASYGLTLGGMALLVMLSWRAMRSAEAGAARLTRRDNEK